MNSTELAAKQHNHAKAWSACTEAFMFNFEGYLERRQYALASVLRLGLFAASVLGFPLFLLALKTVTKCGNDTCGAVGLVSAMAFKPLAFALFTFSFVGVSIRRARDTGMPGWVGLFIPLLFMADYAFLVFSGAPWSFGFSAGQLSIPVPLYALLAIGCVAVLSTLPPRNGTRLNPFGYAGWVALGLGSYIALFAVLAFAATVPGVSSAMVPLARVAYFGKQILPVTMAVFFANLVWIAWNARGVQMAGPRLATAPPAGRKLPMMMLAAVAAVLTLAAISLSLSKGMSIPLVIVVQFTPMVLPTFLLYFGLLASLYLVVARRTFQSAAISAVVLFPFAHWAYAHSSTAQQHQREADEIAAIHTTRALRLPATMVIDSEHVTATRAAWTIPGIDNVILRGAYGSSLMQVTRPRPEDRFFQPGKVSSLPDEYLLLQIGRSSSFAKDRQIYTIGGPLELRLVDPNRNELIAVWYHAYNPSPSLVPVLTNMGWFRGSNSATTDEIQAIVSDFLARALAPNS
jgi:uncharacterized membrane protein YhaH (DUF805 family)